MISTTDAYIGLTDLLDGEVRILRLQLLVHSISEEDPTVHGTRCLLDAAIRATWLGVCLGCLRFGLGDWLKVKVVLLAHWHLDNSLAAIDAGGEDESNRMSHMLDESALKVLHEHVAEELLDVSLK